MLETGSLHDWFLWSKPRHHTFLIYTPNKPFTSNSFDFHGSQCSYFFNCHSYTSLKVEELLMLIGCVEVPVVISSLSHAVKRFLSAAHHKTPVWRSYYSLSSNQKAAMKSSQHLSVWMCLCLNICLTIRSRKVRHKETHTSMFRTNIQNNSHKKYCMHSWQSVFLFK